jgi:DNA primase
MRIPDDKVDEVRSATDIVDVISSVTRLRKRGRSFVGLCPFHQEKTPSFTVSADKQMYHCFGCGVGGNVFTFLMERDKLSFVEAVRVLAERAGISLPAEGSTESGENSEQEQLSELTRLVGLHFHDNLVNSVEGSLALEYFHHRGFTETTIRKFGLGYARNSWDDLLAFARQENIEPALLDRAGLVVRREDGSGYYDRFRGRTIFPIFSTNGRTIAFGARKLREDDPLGKYINSPETPIYSKSRVLYGLSIAKEAIREREFALIVEGYADLITVFQAGFENIVASSGTALTVEQIQLLSRYARRVTLVYDADSAGSKATLRGGDLVLEHDLDVRVAELPAGEDPDSFVCKHGAKAFQDLLDGAVSFLDFRAQQLQAEGLFSTPEGKAQAIRQLVETVARVKDELKRTFFLKRLAETYDVYESVLARELERVLGKRAGTSRVERPPDRQQQSAKPPSGHSPKMPGTPLPAPERDLLRLLLEYGSPMAEFVFERLEPDMLTAGASREIMDTIRKHREAGEHWDAGTMLAELTDPDLRGLVSELSLQRHELSKGWSVAGTEPPPPDPWIIARDCIVMLKSRGLDRHIAELYRGMKDAELRGEAISAYQQEILDLQREKQQLHTRVEAS